MLLVGVGLVGVLFDYIKCSIVDATFNNQWPTLSGLRKLAFVQNFYSDLGDNPLVLCDFIQWKNCWKVVGVSRRRRKWPKAIYQGILNNFSFWLFHPIFNIINLYFVVSFICNGINQTCALTFGRNGFSLATLIQNLGFAELFHRAAMNPHQLFYRRSLRAAELKPARYACLPKCGPMMKISSDKWKWIRRSVAALESSKYFP